MKLSQRRMLIWEMKKIRFSMINIQEIAPGWTKKRQSRTKKIALKKRVFVRNAREIISRGKYCLARRKRVKKKEDIPRIK
jgi:hypothetical protein